MRFRHRDTGVVVSVRDDKPMDGVWEPADVVSAGSDAAENDDDSTTCPDCGFVAKTAGGLGAHRRTHD